MMKVAELQLDHSQVSQSEATGLVTAGIWLNVEGTDFPAAHWRDFAVVILSWWTSALTRLLNAESDLEQVRFMDGPYLAVVSRTAHAASWRLDLVKDIRAQLVVGSEEVDQQRLAASVLRASSTMLLLCSDRGWDTGDSTRLAASTASLRDALRKVGPASGACE